MLHDVMAVEWSLLQRARYSTLTAGKKPFLELGDAAYRQRAGGAPSNGHEQHAQNLVKITRVVPEISCRTDRHTDREAGRQTDRQTDKQPIECSACPLPFPQIFPTIDSLPASGLTPRLYDWSVSSEHLGFLFLVFFISLFCFFPCGRLS